LFKTIDKPSVFAAALIAFWALALATGIGTPKGWIADHHGIPIDGDYVGLYTAGELALRGAPGAAYDAERHKAAQRQLREDPNGGFYPWPYPPSFLFVAAALATMPYYLSMLTWVLTTFAAFAAALARITVSRRDLLLMLATPAAWLNLYVGQNGALTAALIGFGLVLLPAQPVAAGICIGLLSLKPHLGLLIPIALLAGGYFRAFAAAVLTVLALVISSVVVFGADPWLAMPYQLERVTALVKTTNLTEKIQSAFGLARSLGLSIECALWIQAAVVAASAGLIGWLWSRRTVSFDLKAAALAAALTLASPYQFVYDLVILTIAQAFLLRHFARTRADRIDICGLELANILVFLFATTRVPLGIVGGMIVMALILRHLRHGHRADPQLTASRTATFPLAGA